MLCWKKSINPWKVLIHHCKIFKYRTVHTPLRQTTEERIRWVEETMTSEGISDQIKRICEKLHGESTTSGKNPFSSLKDNFGFSLRKDISTIANAGFGLFLEGKVAPASVVAIYPGVVYHPGDPSLFPSLRNDYIIKRMDGSCVDGKYWGLSRYMYNSIAMRDGPTSIFDNTWHLVSDKQWHDKLRSPLAMGQMINNGTENPNVTYFEFEFPTDFPHHLWYLVPNINYQGARSFSESDCLVKSIAMVTLREINDEELFSEYSWVGMSNAQPKR